MVDHTSRVPRLPVATILVLLIVAAIFGGLIARLIPLGSATSPQHAPVSGASANLPALVQKTASAVVNIAVLQPSPAEQNPLLQDPFFRRYFGVPDAALQPAMSAGSGVIVDADAGLVVTNFHVVRNARAVEVGLKDGRQLSAEPVALAPQVDLAVLRIRARNLHALPLGDSGKVEVGEPVVAIGNPFGLGQTVTAGIVSATDRPLGDADQRRFIQTDAPINPGNSGGPLIDSGGEIIGINSALFSPDRGQGNVGIGFAIPANVVKQVVARAER
jgi:S1-C subfamily serine protease